MIERRTLPPNLHSQEYGGIAAPHWLVLLPAYTVLPFLRAPLGYDLVRPLPAIRRTAWLIVLPFALEAVWVGFTRAQWPDAGFPYLSAFALIYLATSLGIFAWRWRGQGKGGELHSGDAGYSWLTWYTALPVALCEAVIVPAVLFLLGYAIRHLVSMELGWWLMIAAVSLCAMACWEYLRSRSQQRATTDDLVRAKAFGARVDQAVPSSGTQPQTAKDGPDFADLA